MAKFAPLLKKFLFLLLLFLLIYGSGRMYYHLTDGFSVSNISSNLSYDARWETGSLSREEQASIQQILGQPYFYLGKGCQSYVFGSEDGQYVLKFFKYQRFRVAPWIQAFSFIPPVHSYIAKKNREKKERLEALFWSWKAAYEVFPNETGVLFVHLNKEPELEQSVTIYDKLGFKHLIQLNDTEFMIQKKATLLFPALDLLMKEGNVEEAKRIISELIQIVLNEYQRGYADNDHALMQNTGIINGHPVHIDVGQLIQNQSVKDPVIYEKELHCKMYVFHQKLQKTYPELALHLEAELVSIIGPKYFDMPPYVYKGNVGKIPNEGV